MGTTTATMTFPIDPGPWVTLAPMVVKSMTTGKVYGPPAKVTKVLAATKGVH